MFAYEFLRHSYQTRGAICCVPKICSVVLFLFRTSFSNIACANASLVDLQLTRSLSSSSDFTHKNSSHSIIRALEKMRQKIRVEQAHGYEFENGYRDSSENYLSIQEFEAVLINRSSHLCSDTPKLLGLHYRFLSVTNNTSNVDIIFRARSFLHLLSHKTLYIVGDSFGIQLFQALDVELQLFLSNSECRQQSLHDQVPGVHQHLSNRGNSSRPNVLTHSKLTSMHRVLNASGSIGTAFHAVKQQGVMHRRFYSIYNTTIMFCKNVQISTEDYCVSQIATLPLGSIIVVSHGIFHKPSNSGGNYHSRLEEVRVHP